ncbi:MAG: 3-hydroxyacyl-ACP dehydratase [Candidatus Aminicenantes bacterium]|nr:3-hydroxyacyl-ACP dehydratase [Candidatus Aminicenantes bacterium]
MAAEAGVGIDVGSRTTKIVVLKEGEVAAADVFDTVPGQLPEIRRRLEPWAGLPLVATGYGRRLLADELGSSVVTEIKACALGAHRLRPGCRLVLDIGGQDAKAIRVTPSGGFEDFELNDRCSAGTGRFLEVMAGALGFDLDDFCRAAMSADRAAAVSSMCTVFAESEVVAMLAQGEDRKRLALGLYQSIVDRVYPLASRLEAEGEVLFVGGVARSRCVAGLLRKKLKRDIVVPPNPQIVSALGAALSAPPSIFGRPGL